MLTPNKLERIQYKTVVYYEELQEWIIKEISKRIGRTLSISNKMEYELKRLEEIGLFNKDLTKKISNLSGLTEKEVIKIFKDSGKTNMLNDKRILDSRYVKFENNKEMKDMTVLYALQTNNELSNLTKTLGFKSGSKMLNSTLHVRDYFIKTLDLQYIGVNSGIISYNDAIKNVVKDMVDSGLRSIDYEGGISNQVDVAARRSILGGIKMLTNKQAEINAQKVNTTCYEITWHSGHRPSHLWGGKRFDTTGRYYPTEENLYKMYYDTKTGDIGSLDDYNCYHEKFAVYPDSKPVYTDEELYRLEKEEKKLVDYEGVLYNKYDAKQKQRQLERTMRKIRLEAVGLKETGQEEKYRIRKAKYSILRQKYNQFSNVMGLKTEYQRVYYDMLGKL